MLLPSQELLMFAIISDGKESQIQVFLKEKYGKIDFEAFKEKIEPT